MTARDAALVSSHLIGLEGTHAADLSRMPRRKV